MGTQIYPTFLSLMLMVVCIFTVLVVGIIVKSAPDRIANDSFESCAEFCESNNLNYYKYENRGFASLTLVCYCKDSQGRISTEVI